MPQPFSPIEKTRQTRSWNHGRRITKRLTGRHTALLLTGLLVLTGNVSNIQAATEPMVINRGTSAEPPSLDPNLAAGTLASPIINDLFTGLLSRGPDSLPEPGSAESWEISEDGKTYTFKLRPDLRWSDGRALTAEDFVYSYRRIVDPKTASRLVGMYFPIKNTREIMEGTMAPETLGVSAPDDRTVVFELTQPTPYLLELLTNLQSVPVPRHVIEEHGSGWTKPGVMVSNGAFYLAERVPQSYIGLKKNPNFYDADSVRLDGINWHPTQDLATSLKRFRAGELDIILNFPPSEIGWIRENLADALYITPIPGTYFLVANTRKPPFDDVRVRKALYLAIDRDAIANRLLKTGVSPAWSQVSPALSTYPGIEMEEAQMSFPERQALARQLIKESGYDTSQRIELAYDTNEENRKIMVAIAAMWQSIGVRTELINVEFPMLFRKVRTQNFAMSRWFYIAPFDDAYAMLQLFTADNPNNWPGINNPDFDELLRQSNYVTDPAERQAMLQEAERELMSEYAIIPITYYVGRRLISPRIKGWVDTSAGPTKSRYLSLED